MEQGDKPSQTNLLFLQIILGFAGTVIVAYLGYLGVQATLEIPIHATETAESRVRLISPTATMIVTATATVESTMPVFKPTLEENHAPLIIGIQERKEYDAGNALVIHKDISFTDSDGDAYMVVYKLISTTLSTSEIRVMNDKVGASSDEQKYQAIVVATWKCSIRYRDYTVVLEAQILDKAGNQSKPVTITFVCQ